VAPTPTIDPHSDEESAHAWLWIAALAGAAAAAVAIAYVVRGRDPGYRLDRLLRRCEARMGTVEESLEKLEQSLSNSLS
jgi:hypothetical protein